MKRKQNVDDAIVAKALKHGANYDRIALEHDTTKQEVFKLMLNRASLFYFIIF